MDPRKARYAVATNARTLAEVMGDADIFLGLSAPHVLKPDMVAQMADRPIIMALANPTPEILPEEVKAVRPDAIIATGRSDYPNQVNNALCFPFIFRGALDVGATTINEAMKIATVHAIANLARAEGHDVVAAAYGDEPQPFGPDNLIPKPFDPRLILEIAPAVAKAAMASGVATRPIVDFAAYREELTQFVFRSGLVMRPVFTLAKQDPKRVVYAEGEEERVLRAVQVVVDDGLAKPILIGRTDVVMRRIEKLGLRIRPVRDFISIDPESDPRYNEYWADYHQLMERRGISPDQARMVVRTNPTVIAALMVKRGDADALIAGTIGQYHQHLREVKNIIGLRKGISKPAALNVLVLSKGVFFLADTYVTPEPKVAQLVEMTLLAAEQVRCFGLTPKIALLSHSSFGSHETASALKMQQVLEELRLRAPDLEVEGEMHADAALSETIRNRIFPHSRLKGTANLLIMPTLDAANIAMNLMKELSDGLSIGPLLLGMAQPGHILTPSVTPRGIVNATALACQDAQMVMRE
jgi:malate dehydrogenase (oxaloacetate-decarboxylating)(NADP+)